MKVKTKLLKKLTLLLAALALFANTSAWGAGSASPTSVMVPVGGSVEVTITNNDSNNRTLRIGSTGSTALGTWSNDSLSATLSSTSVSSGRTTTLTITGLAIADETYVLVRDDQHKAEEHNAQGAVYTLKTRVVGCPEIPVQISPGVSADVAWANWADPEAELTIEITGDAAGVYSARFVEGHDHGDGFVMTISADESATYGQSAVIAVKAGGVTLARYACSVMPPFAVQEGTTAPGHLYGVDATPWVSRSSDPSVITVTPTKYNRMYSAEAKFLQ